MQLTPMALPSPNPQLPPKAEVPLGELTRDATPTQSTPKDRDPSDTLLSLTADDLAKDGSDTEAAEAAHEEVPSNTRDQDPTSTVTVQLQTTRPRSAV